MNVEISDNKYSKDGTIPVDMVRAEKVKNIYGADVTENGTSLIKDSE